MFFLILYSKKLETAGTYVELILRLFLRGKNVSKWIVFSVARILIYSVQFNSLSILYLSCGYSCFAFCQNSQTRCLKKKPLNSAFWMEFIVIFKCNFQAKHKSLQKRVAFYSLNVCNSKKDTTLGRSLFLWSSSLSLRLLKLALGAQSVYSYN